MFKNAIKKNLECVKPFATAYKTINNDELNREMFPVLLINEEGWALTTKSIVNNIVIADKLQEKYSKIREELIENKVPPKRIYKKYKIKDDEPLILKNVFLNTMESWEGFQLFAHDTLDLALIKFKNPKTILCNNFPVFAKSNSSQGEYLCRLGYPYPEFESLRYDYASKDIVVNEIISCNLQIFPVEGMLTRYLLDKENKLTLFELSNATYVGEGPVINKNGEIVGFQVGQAYKDTFVDINTKIKRNNKEISVKQYNFLPYSICINVETIKKFLDKHKVKYEEK